VKPPPGISHVDRLCEAQDRRDRIAALRIEAETRWIESHFEKSGPRIETDYEPFDNTHMKK